MTNSLLHYLAFAFFVKDKLIAFIESVSGLYSVPFIYFVNNTLYWGFLGSSVGKESACNAGGCGSIPGPGRSPGKGHDNPFQYSCLENTMDRGDWQSTFHRIAKSWTQLDHFYHKSISFFKAIIFCNIYRNNACMLSHSVISDSCSPMDCSPPGSSLHGIFQAKILDWVAIFFSRGSS